MLIISYFLTGVDIGGVTIYRILLVLPLSLSDSSAHNSYESFLFSNILRELCFIKRITLARFYLMDSLTFCLLSLLATMTFELLALTVPSPDLTAMTSIRSSFLFISLIRSGLVLCRWSLMEFKLCLGDFKIGLVMCFDEFFLEMS